LLQYRIMNGSGIIKVIIADYQYLITESLKLLLKAERRFSVEAVVSTKPELIKILGKLKPDLIITEVTLPDGFDINDLLNINKEYPELALLILTNSLNKSDLLRITASGIRNIIYKSADKEEILNAVDFTLKGKRYFSEEILDMLIEPANSKQVNEKQGKLTSSETEIVRLIANGLTAKEIALKKNLSIHTVNTHRKKKFKKLEVKKAFELIMVAIKAGCIDNIEYYI